MELGVCLRIARRWLGVIVLGAVLAAGVAYVVSSHLPPVYRASVSLLVRANPDRPEDYGMMMVDKHLAANYREVLTKRPILETAAQNIGLAPSTANELMTKVAAWVVPDTSVLRLTVDHHNARLAMELANEIVAVFVQSQRESGEAGGKDIIVVEPAYEPAAPVAPRTMLNTAVAAVGGLVLAIGIAFLLDRLGDQPGPA